MENDSQKITQECLVCRRGIHSFFCNKNGYNLYRCEHCGLLFVHPLPAETASIYAQDYFSGAHGGFGYVDYDTDKKAMSSIFRDYLSSLARELGRTGNLLDVGAATGFFMKIAQEEGWNVRGVEMSEYAAGKGRAEGLPIITGTLADLHDTDGFFDAITAWDVIEHMPTPGFELDRMHRMLSPGGYLMASTPDAGSWYARMLGKNWHLLVPPEHLFYFNRKNIGLLLGKHGFDLVRIEPVRKRFTLEYIAHILAGWLKVGPLRKVADILATHPRIGRREVPIPLGDNMLVLARKKR